MVANAELPAQVTCYLTTVQANEFVLRAYPVGVPGPDHIQATTRALEALQEKSVRVRTLLWGVDPGLRSRLSGVTTYAPPIALDSVITGFVVGEVLETKDDRFAVGDIVTGAWGWRDVANVRGDAIQRAPERGDLPLSSLLGVLGIPGITAYFGMLDIGRLQPGETVLVTSAAGGVGSIASQIARVKGARVIGLAGGEAKCAWLRDTLGLDGTIDYRATPDLDAALTRSFPEGIDVVFENIGNRVVDAVLPHLRTKGRVVVCGQTEDYNLPLEARHGIKNTIHVIGRRVKIEGLVAMDYAARYEEARHDLRGWTADGRVVTKEHVDVGFERLPAAFASLFGENALGRKLVACS